MALTTAFTASLGPRHPIALAPMGGSAGGALAAAVSNSRPAAKHSYAERDDIDYVPV
ncbi:hypothetical protein [Streptomyces sp. RPT161]|uniref:hypothetical protein n=1 Tax=Streptomyces sp. RPT161 TaxID=3015993 RepID=UPI0022B8FABC|nr:hypothetical protein [Streptomyces sp. RPT161]